MKKIFYSTVTLTLSILISVTAFGQGINQLWGITTPGGSEDIGVVFRANGDGSNAQARLSFTRTNPGATPMYNQLTEYNAKFYAVTMAGGANNSGVIFEWDPVTNIYTKKYDCNSTGGSNPYGSLALMSGKFYGMTNTGGSNNKGVIFEWDPATNIYTKKYDFEGTNGGNPFGSLLLESGKFYGMTNTGGSNNLGVIFEWDPAGSGTYTKKHDFDGTTGGNPYGDLVIKDGKLYGMTHAGNINNDGVIFEWDPATNIYTMKFAFGSVVHVGENPYGSLVLESGKFYGMTSGGGDNAKGVIFEWDPGTNIYTKKFDFGGGYTNGDYPYGNLVMANGKFYGMASLRGTARYGEGLLFEWGPVTDIYTKKSDFTGSNGRTPDNKNNLVVVPAPVARGVANSCVNLPAVTIGTGNSNSRVPILDTDGNLVAEIKANGNNLGIVNTTVYINNTSVREDDENRLYSDRNITITSEHQPDSAVDIRLYITATEFVTLKNATNSYGSPSGITTINDLSIFKNNDDCGSSIVKKAKPVITTASTWGTDYVLSASVKKFSTFYFASKADIKHQFTFLEISGKLQSNDVLLNWKSDNELNTSAFIVERSIDGSEYKKVGTVTAANRPGIQGYSFTDQEINTSIEKPVYYRLKQKDSNGDFVYSKSLMFLLNSKKNFVTLYPNPVVNNELRLAINLPQQDIIRLQIIDATGRIIQNQIKQVTTGSTSFTIDISKMSKGIYFLSIEGRTGNKKMQFVKQ